MFIDKQRLFSVVAFPVRLQLSIGKCLRKSNTVFLILIDFKLSKSGGIFKNKISPKTCLFC